MPKRKNEVKFCEGCLASSLSRTLKPISDYYNEYLLIMCNNIKRCGQDKYPLMCWECRAVLQKIVKFQERCATANDYLVKHIGKAKRKVMYLSDLMTTYNDTWFEMTHEEPPTPQPVTQIYLYQVIPMELLNVSQDTNTQPEMSAVVEIESDSENDIQEMGKRDTDREEDCKQDEEITGKQNLDEEIPRKPELLETNEGRQESDMKRDEIRQKKNISMKSKYSIINLPPDEEDGYVVMEIDDEERRILLEKQRSSRIYRNKTYKCEQCLRMFSRYGFENHSKQRHSKSLGDFECHHCGKNVKTKRTLLSHMERHYRKYLCTSCDYVCLSFRQMHLHNSTHRRLFECLKCGEGFSKRSAFYKHYSSVHTRVVCDHCNKSICSKNKLISHIRRLHTNHICTPCNHKFSTHDALQRHRRLTHSSSSSELSYCVECDLQFDNVYRYRRHINSSMKHKVKVGVPCPVCKRVYHKTWAMNNHYKLVHLKKTDYHCGLCSRYFLNGYRHRQHVTRVHDNIAPTRDKVCTICGRGFSTNRILSNHVRSHTGERPHACEHCDAKFTQKYSLRTHTRTVHKLQ